MEELIITTIMAMAPSLISVITVAIISAVTKKFNEKKLSECIEHVDNATAEIKSSKEYAEVKEQLALSHKENVELKKKINQLLTKIDKVQRTEEEE